MGPVANAGLVRRLGVQLDLFQAHGVVLLDEACPPQVGGW